MLYLVNLYFFGIPFYGIKTISIHQQVVVFFLLVCRFLVFFFTLLFVFSTEVVLSDIFSPIKSPVASAIC